MSNNISYLKYFYTEYTNMIIPFIAILISFIIGTIQIYLNIEANKRQEKEYQRRLEEHNDYINSIAYKFLMENSEDIKFLPLCKIAFIHNCQKKYAKSIYNNFCILPIEIQNRILFLKDIKNFLINNKITNNDILKILETIEHNQYNKKYIEYIENIIEYSKYDIYQTNIIGKTKAFNITHNYINKNYEELLIYMLNYPNNTTNKTVEEKEIDDCCYLNNYLYTEVSHKYKNNVSKIPIENFEDLYLSIFYYCMLLKNMI